LECMGMQASGDLIWTGIKQPGVANLNLSHSKFARLMDERASWPIKGHLILDGFVFQNLAMREQISQDKIPEERINWLERQSDLEIIKPQPWLQVSKILEANGDSDGAKRVIYEFRRQQVRAANPLLRTATFIYDRRDEHPLRLDDFKV
jgi:hypothetical protein